MFCLCLVTLHCGLGQYRYRPGNTAGGEDSFHVHPFGQEGRIGKDAERRTFRRIASGLCRNIKYNTVLFSLYLDLLFKASQGVLLLALQAVKELSHPYPRAGLYSYFRDKGGYRSRDGRFALIDGGRHEDGFLRNVPTDGVRQRNFRGGFRFGCLFCLTSATSGLAEEDCE